MKQQEISQDTPIPLDSIFFFRTFHLCISCRHHCMEFFGLRMPLPDIATPTRTTVSFKPHWHSKSHLQYRTTGNTVTELPMSCQRT